ncbi:MAG: GNAT family N-acetyltransferase [Nitrospirae bacterium]|nr:MAG: GNAT family N-acetyltransferase [Nitrospirota bacterium]
MNILIRKARNDDFNNIVELFKQLWPDKKSNPKRLLTAFTSMILSENYELLCAEKDGVVIGFCSLLLSHNFWVEGNILYITTFIIDEKYRNQGIGKKLMEAVNEIAREKGCKKIELESGFHRKDAHTFYGKMGFDKRAYFFSRDVRQKTKI